MYSESQLSLHHREMGEANGRAASLVNPWDAARLFFSPPFLRCKFDAHCMCLRMSWIRRRVIGMYTTAFSHNNNVLEQSSLFLVLLCSINVTIEPFLSY